MYPGHGVAIIDGAIERVVGEKNLKLFKLKFLFKDTTILLPQENINACSIRELCDKEAIKSVFALFYKPLNKKFEYIDFTPSGWNRRNKEYQLKIQSGKIEDVAYVYRDLMTVAIQKELSFGEKKILQTAEDLLVQEIQVVTGQDSSSVVEQLHSPFKQLLFAQPTIRPLSSTI